VKIRIPEMTLVEWMIVVSIVGIVAAIAIPNLMHMNDRCARWVVGPPMYYIPRNTGGIAYPIENRSCAEWVPNQVQP
jgi:prepilin-type N-terminal cleavage/methylation domain-containing protein